MREIWRTGIGQDSHRFAPEESDKVLMLGGVPFPGERGLEGNSDADVILHALCNAISGVTGVNILGGTADRMVAQGLTDSSLYLREALRCLDPAHNSAGRRLQLVHISLSVEALSPHLAKHISAIKIRIAQLTGLSQTDVGLTATTGEGLTAFGQGLGMQCTAIVTIREVAEY